MKLTAVMFAAILALAATAAPADVTQTGQTVSGTGAVATSGAQTLALPGDSSRAWVYCQNPTTATENLFVEVGAPASLTTSYAIVPGGVWSFVSGVVPTNGIFVTANTAAHPYVCKAGDL